MEGVVPYIRHLPRLGQSFRGRKLLFNCDNQAVVDIWSAKTSKCSSIMSLLRKIFFLSAKHKISLNVSHILGTDNGISDAFFVHR